MAIVLGISPATRGIGFAVLTGHKLTDWKMQSFQQGWSTQKLHSMLEVVKQYMKRHQVDAVAIKIPDELPVSKNYIQLVGALNVLFERQGIKPMYYTLSDLKQHYCKAGKSNKAILSDCIVYTYPELLPEHRKEQANRNSYYTKIFEAIGAARLYHEQLGK